MEITTSEAARRLNVHPAQLFQLLARLGGTLDFEEVWPTIDEGWVQTLEVAARGAPAGGAIRKTRSVEEQSDGPPSDHGLTDTALHVLDKLARHDKWGVAAVPTEALTNLTRLAARKLEDAIAELRRAGLLDRDGTGIGTISLASSQRKRIELITGLGQTQSNT